MKKFMLLHYGFETPTPEIMGAWEKWFLLAPRLCLVSKAHKRQEALPRAALCVANPHPRVGVHTATGAQREVATFSTLSASYSSTPRYLMRPTQE